MPATRPPAKPQNVCFVVRYHIIVQTVRVGLCMCGDVRSLTIVSSVQKMSDDEGRAGAAGDDVEKTIKVRVCRRMGNGRRARTSSLGAFCWVCCWLATRSVVVVGQALEATRASGARTVVCVLR